MKKEIRKNLIAGRNSMDEKDIYDKSVTICENILEMNEYKTAENLLLYMHFGSEVKLDSLLERAVSDGKNVYIPKILDDDKTKVMRFYRYDGHFTKGSFGILEPQNVSETSMYPDMKEGVSDTLMIMPGVAFDINKNRLGYGGGFYDRYLQEHKEFDIYKAAVAFDMQVLDELPVDIYDIKADCIVTEKRIII